MKSKSELVFLLIVILLAALFFTGLYVELRYHRDGIREEPATRPAACVDELKQAQPQYTRAPLPIDLQPETG